MGVLQNGDLAAVSFPLFYGVFVMVKRVRRVKGRPRFKRPPPPPKPPRERASGLLGAIGVGRRRPPRKSRR